MQAVRIGPNQAGIRMDKFLHKLLPVAPNGFIYKMLRKKNITLNGGRAQGNEILCEGDEVKLFFSDETFAKLGGDAAGKDGDGYAEAFHRLKGIRVVYEDRHVIILDKPAGVLTQKAEASDLSLNEWMIGYLLHQGKITKEELSVFHPSVCNRLDRNTGGLVICGKSLAGSQAVSELLRERRIRKFYRALAEGVMTKSCRVDGYLVKDHLTNTVRIVPEAYAAENADAFKITTSYTPLAIADGRYTYLEVELVTGKPHQIRAHLAHLGHPLVGDAKYADMRLNRLFMQKYALSGQFLYACRLEFPPLKGVLENLSGKKISVPLPPLFQKILDSFTLEENLHGHMELQRASRLDPGRHDQPHK